MKKSSSLFYAGQIGASLAAAAIGYALLPKPKHGRRVVIITGGSRGLGFALAERFGRAGDKLILTARDEHELHHARLSLLERGVVANEDDILLVGADLTDAEQSQGLIAAAVNAFGRIDVLINNAGIINVGPFEDQAIEAYHRAMQTNFFAALYTVSAALPYLLESKRSSGRDASIVNISSIGGKIAVPHLLPYVASKFALTGFSEGLHSELRHKGVRVTTVCPGLMRTGGEVHAHFTGQVEKEKRWFQVSATTPLLSADVKHAANRIFNAVEAGRAEITITPQAWLAARFAGLCPESYQVLSALVNEWVLPEPLDAKLAADGTPDQSGVAVPAPS